MSKLEQLQKEHKRKHNFIEAAEAEKAPEEFIKKLKVEKLNIKDEIERVDKNYKLNYNG